MYSIVYNEKDWRVSYEKGIKTLRQEQNIVLWSRQVEVCNSAVIYSIIETAKENNLDPYKYLTYIFAKAPNLEKDEALDVLLPWSVLEECKSYLRKGNAE